MATYLAPGVYVEEVPSAVKPIAGVGTSTAGFIGVVANTVSMPELPDGSNNKYTKAAALDPQPINSWLDFEQKFGAIQTGNQILAHAVYGFFNNGGTRCWVVRVNSIDDASKGIDTLETIDEVAMVAAPMPADTTQAALNTLHTALVAHCQKMEDRVAILDSAATITDGTLEVTEDDKGIWRPSANKKGYGAFYFPWIQVADPLQPAGTRIDVPPSGHMAGIYSRSDAQRGVHKAPANEVIMGALGTKYPVSKIAQGALNPKGVNVIRNFNGTIKVYGARSLASDPQGDPEWTYIATRRLFNFMRESIEDGTQWMVFEPNTPDLWAKVRRNVNAFLTTVWESGALFGNTPEEAFYVRCDDQTNPPEVRDMGQVVTEIGLSVVKPAEFVIFRISQSAGAGQ